MLAAIKRVFFSKAINSYLHFTGYPALPDLAVIDPVNICNLACPLCPTGKKISDYPQAVMSLELFKNIVDRIPSARYICLYNWGEPFLNQEIFGMVKYARKLYVPVEISTNFSLERDHDFFDEIIRSGLSRLRVSLNGASQESYSVYNVGGNFKLVMENMRKLVEAKKRLKKNNPEIIWKFVANAFNEYQISRAREMAVELNVKFELERINVSDDLPDVEFDEPVALRQARWFPRADGLRAMSSPWLRKLQKQLLFGLFDNSKPASEYPCPLLYRQIVVNPDGKVSPCCFTVSRNSIFGDLSRESLFKIWTGKCYSYSRSLFTGSRHKGAVQSVCVMCRNFKKYE